MKKLLLLPLLILGLNPAFAADEWLPLFDGKTLDGWKASEHPEVFSVKDGVIVVKGVRAHLYYVGAVNKADFKNFEFKADIMTKPSANSGVYFHTKFEENSWPSKGYEVQVNNSHGDTIRTGSLWAIQNHPEVPAKDNEWFTLEIKVEGKHVVTKVNGKVVSDYTEEEPAKRDDGLKGRVIDHGTFAIQGHDPGSEIHYKNILVKPLP